MDELLTITSLLIIFIAIVAVYIGYGRKSPQYKTRANLKLAELDPQINSNDLHQMKNALFEIDKLLDFVLKNRKTKGETLGERLKNVQNKFDWNEYQKIWEAHKLRNKIAHEMDFTPKPDAIKSAYKQLRKAINSL